MDAFDTPVDAPLEALVQHWSERVGLALPPEAQSEPGVRAGVAAALRELFATLHEDAPEALVAAAKKLGARPGAEAVGATSSGSILASRRREEELIRVRLLSESALLAGSVATFTWDIPTDRLHGDASFARLFGVQLDALGSAPLSDYLAVIHPDDRAAVAAVVDRSVNAGGPTEDEYRVVCEGRVRWVTARWRVERDEAGSPLRCTGVLVDITDRKQAEAEREQTRRQMAELLETMDEAFFSMTPDWRITFVNRRYEELSQRTREEVVGQVLWEFFPATAHPTSLYWREYRRCMEERVPTAFVEHYTPLDLWTDVHAFPTSDGGITAFFRDVTAQKRAEAALQASEERYRLLFDSMDEGVCLVEMLGGEPGRPLDYRFLEINAAFAKQAGLEGVVGKTMRELVPTHEEHWFETYGRVAATGEPVRFENEAKALGRWFDVYASRVGAPERRQVAILFKDTTDHRRAEQERVELLRREREAQSEAEVERHKLHDLFTQTPVCIAIIEGPDHLFTFANPAYRRLVGGRDVIGKLLDDALPEVRGQGFAELLTQVRTTGVPFVGTEMPVVFDRTGTGKPEQAYLNFTYSPKRGLDGTFDGVLASLVDVTPQVLARQQAEEASRLKDDFLATVSHELRSPLNAMLGWVVLLRAGKLPLERQPRALETIERNARSQAQIIDDLLDMSRIITGKLALETRPLEVSAVVETALESIRPAAQAKGIRLRPVLGSGGLVMGDPDRLQQVVWNLLTNAVKFTPQDGVVQVSVQRLDSAVELTVTDSGQGIAPDFLPYVFERFRQADGGTTRAKGGLGLGLSIVKQLVEMHGGTVHAASEGEGWGASFTVRLPLSAPRRENTTALPSPGHSEAIQGELAGLRLLIVDDEEDSREMLALTLVACGATVRQAASAEEGRRSFAAERPDLVVSDIGMPGENGYEFIASLRRLPPGQGGTVPAVALTAYARSEDRTKALKAGFTSHMAKPVQGAQLIAVISSLARHVPVTTV